MPSPTDAALLDVEQGERSPLLRDVFVFLRELLRDHKAHLQDILARDRQLAHEIDYDMRQLRAAAPPHALQPLSPHSFTPSSVARRRSGGRASLTPRPSDGLREVPTPDRMKHVLGSAHFSVPDLDGTEWALMSPDEPQCASNGSR